MATIKVSNLKNYAINTKVEWDWGKGSATGYVRKKYTERVSKQLQGNEVTRNASESDPAYLIEQDDGSEVLKSHSELNKSSS
jgi:hypothetical protein